MSLELKIAIILITSFAICLIRSFRLKKLVNFRDFLDAAINVGTVILAVSLLIRVFREEQINSNFDNDIVVVNRIRIEKCDRISDEIVYTKIYG